MRGNHGEHWLNGAKVVEFDLGTPVMDSLLARSKYHVYPGLPIAASSTSSCRITTTKHGTATSRSASWASEACNDIEIHRC